MKHVLIVDDDDQIRGLLCETFGQAGYDTLSAANGLEALEMVNELPCDIIIADILMPEKEGIELIMDLRLQRPDMPIIAMSGGGHVGAGKYLGIAERLGVKATFQKPFDRRELLRTVEGLLAEDKQDNDIS
jgi:DNA-binding response OmpR family regulator